MSIIRGVGRASVAFGAAESLHLTLQMGRWTCGPFIGKAIADNRSISMRQKFHDRRKTPCIMQGRSGTLEGMIVAK